MEIHELLATAGRTLVVYVFMLAVLRLLGKRTVGNFSPFDLLVALMLGEVVDEVIFGDVPLLKGAVAVLVIALAQYVTEWLTFTYPVVGRIVEGSPTIIVRDGQLQLEGMKKERMSEADVHSQLRQQSIEDIREVKMALVEPDGKVSILLQEWAEPVQKGDLEGEEAAQKQKETQGQETPANEQCTISSYALGKAA